MLNNIESEARSRILIVDDEPVNLEVLAAVLEDQADIHFATSGQMAIDMLLKIEVDLILLDVLMPDMDGYEVCKTLKNDPQTANIPVIFVTGKTNQIDEAAGLKCGAIDYVTKPVNPLIVKVRVQNHLDLKKYRDKLESQSFIDGLTGISNRRYFDVKLQDEWKRCVREKSPLTIIMSDIDFFKPYNDHYGHVAGDVCLQKVASAMNSVILRPADYLARYGGEEFAIILSGSDGEGASHVVKNLQTVIRALKEPHSKSTVSDFVSMSFGVASMVPTVEVKPELLIQAADKYLYQAKTEGRDRFVIGPG